METTPGQATEAPTSYDTDSAAEALFQRFQAKQDEPEAPETPEEAPATPEAEAPDEGQVEEVEEVEEAEEELEWEGAKFKVKGADPKQLRDALLRQADYTRKTMEVAEQRKAFEAQRKAHDDQLQLREATLEKRAELVALRNEYQKIVSQDWDALTNENPLEALKQQAKLKQLETRASAVLTEVQQAEHQVLAWKQQQAEEALRHGSEVLMREIPGWNRDAQQRVIEFGRAIGYTDKELAEVVDPRFVKALHKARLYDELQAKKPQVTKRVAEAPKSIKPGPGNQNTPGKVRTDEADARLRKSGRLDDAANAILARIVKGK